MGFNARCADLTCNGVGGFGGKGGDFKLVRRAVNRARIAYRRFVNAVFGFRAICVRNPDRLFFAVDGKLVEFRSVPINGNAYFIAVATDFPIAEFGYNEFIARIIIGKKQFCSLENHQRIL